MSSLVFRGSVGRSLNRALAALAGLVIVSAALAQEIDEVVLIVDDIAVTEHEYSVLHFIQTQADVFSPAGPDLNSDATQQIVDDMLLAAHAGRLAPEFVISDTQLNEAVEGLAARNQVSADQLLAQLESQGVDVGIFKSSLRQRLLVQEVIGQRLTRSVAITPDEVQEYIANRPELNSQSKSTYRVSHLVISIAEDQNNREVKALRATTEEIRKKLLAGESFESIDAAYEEASASGDKGDLGWRKQDELPELFVGALKNMQVGQVSAVLESSNGFHLLSMTDIQSSSTVPNEYYIRHIAKTVAPPADGRQQAQQLQNAKLQILAGLDFAAIARAESDDRESAVNGGDLGWLQLQQIDPAFAEAILQLQPGEISDPVRSQYGFHLIQLMQSRPVPGAPTLESQVQQVLFGEKLAELMEDLLNDLKQVALVEVVE